MRFPPTFLTGLTLWIMLIVSLTIDPTWLGTVLLVITGAAYRALTIQKRVQ